MIKVEVYRDRSRSGVSAGRGVIRRIKISGHAGFAKLGEDIVCAAASATIYTAAGSLEELCGAPNTCAEERDGFFELNVPVFGESREGGDRGSRGDSREGADRGSRGESREGVDRCSRGDSSNADSGSRGDSSNADRGSRGDSSNADRGSRGDSREGVDESNNNSAGGNADNADKAYRADIIMETAFIGFKQIEASYPGFIKVKERSK